MKYLIEERFSDNLGFTFEKANGKEEGKLKDILYIMRHGENVFELLDRERYEIAKRQHREEFQTEMAADNRPHLIG